MAIEILGEPDVQVINDTTFNVLARDTETQLSVGHVATRPITVEHLDGDIEKVAISVPSTHVTGQVGTALVYEKVVESKGYLGSPRPLYGLRTAIAKKRAAHKVITTLHR